MEGCVPAELEEVFGAESLDHTLVLLTCGDYLMGKTVEVLEMCAWPLSRYLYSSVSILIVTQWSCVKSLKKQHRNVPLAKSYCTIIAL